MAVASDVNRMGSGQRLFLAFAIAVILAALCVGLSRGAPAAKEANIVAAASQAATDSQAAVLAAARAKKKTDAVTAARAQALAKQTQAASDASAARLAALEAAQPAAGGSVYYAWFGALAVALLWLVSAVLAGDVNPFSLAVGLDNRLSTSKLQALLWTGGVAFVYAMIYADRVIVYGHVEPITQIPQNVLFALGLSVTSAVAAKAITSSQVAANPGNKDAAAEPSYDPSALVREDGASSASLSKVQVLFWTVIAIIVYVNSAFHDLTTIAGCTGIDCSFPDIDTTLMIFMGLGHATYLGGKLIGNSTPMLSKILPTGTDPNTGMPALALSGASLGSSGTALLNGESLGDDFIDSWTATKIKLRLDPALGPWSAGDQIAIAVNVAGSVSPSMTYVFPATAVPVAVASPPPAVSEPTKPTTSADATSEGEKPITAALPTTLATTPQATGGSDPAKTSKNLAVAEPIVVPVKPPATTVLPVPVQALLRGIDVSFAQGLKIDWDAVHRSGLAGFVYARATFSANPADDDPNFVRNHDECKRLGIPFGAYHFFRFTDPAADQARHFLATIDGRTGTLCPMVDVEEQSGRGDSVSDMIANLSDFITAVQHALGRAMVIYTNSDTWNNVLGGSDAFAGHRLWVASFTEDPEKPPAMPTGFPDWTIHQYSESGHLPFTDGTSGAVDLDVLKGPLAIIESGPAPAQAAAVLRAAPGPLASLRYDGVAKKLQGIDANGQHIFSYDARNDSVASNAWRPDAGCPPGMYRLLSPEGNDPAKPSTGDNDWVGEGRWFIPIDGIPGHEGIGIHGGGTCKTPPDSNALLPRQGWCPTENCIRVQNVDLAVLAGLPLNGKPIEVVQ